MAIKKFKTKEEALAAMKKATDRKRTLIEYLKKGYSLEELERLSYTVTWYPWFRSSTQVWLPM